MVCGQAVFRVWPKIIEDAHARRILPGEKCGAIGRANWRARIGVCEAQTFLCQVVKVWGLVELVAVTTQLRPAEVVRQDENILGGTANRLFVHKKTRASSSDFIA